jgi:hypothetical protein
MTWWSVKKTQGQLYSVTKYYIGSWNWWAFVNTVMNLRVPQGKVVPMPFVTEHYAMKAYWGMEVQLQHSLTSALHGGDWSASRSGRFTPRERAPGTRLRGGWVGPRAVLDAVVKRKIPSFSRGEFANRMTVSFSEWTLFHREGSYTYNGTGLQM